MIDVKRLDQEVRFLQTVCKALEERGQKDIAAAVRSTRRYLAELLWHELLRKDENGNYINTLPDSSEIPTA